MASQREHELEQEAQASTLIHSPVGGLQHPSQSLNARVGDYNPEDYYRQGSPDHNKGDSNSPADSQAPLWPQNQHSAPPTPEINQYQYPAQQYYPPPPIPEQSHYSFGPSTMGPVNGEIGSEHPTAVNGEIGAEPYVDPRDPRLYEFRQHDGDDDNGVRVPATPLSAGLNGPRSAGLNGPRSAGLNGPMSAGLNGPKTPAVIEKEEEIRQLEEKVYKEDKKDLGVKLKVRLAKIVLRSVNCACSLVVLALVASTFQIFIATKNLAHRAVSGKELTPWSPSTPLWPQIVILVISCLSLILSLGIMFSYWKGGHRLAERAALHATIFAGGVFIFTIAIWCAGIGIMQGSRSGSSDQDMWGWACKDNVRRKVFQDAINYKLVCRQQDWVVVCAIIEISVETLTIAVYIFAFYRLFYTKKRLRKSMHIRDEARSSLWMQKLKEQQDADGNVDGDRDSQTNQNTALNSAGVFINAEEGRAVPILQPAPRGHRFTNSNGGNMNGSLKSLDEKANASGEQSPLQPPPPVLQDEPRNPMRASRTVSFQQAPGTPRTPRAVSFQQQPGGSRTPSPPRSGSQGSGH